MDFFGYVFPVHVGNPKIYVVNPCFFGHIRERTDQKQEVQLRILRVSLNKNPWLFLTTSTQKSLNQFLAFLNSYQHEKNHIIPSVHFWDTVNLNPVTRLAISFLTMLSLNVLNCVKLYQHAQNQLTPSLHYSDTVNFRVQRPDWPHSEWLCPTDQPLILYDFVSTCKKRGCFIDFF